MLIFYLELLGNKDVFVLYEDQFCGEKDYQYEGIVLVIVGIFLFLISLDKIDLMYIVLSKNI